MAVADLDRLEEDVESFLADVSSADPHALFRRLRECDPIHRTRSGAFLLTRYADAEVLFRDPRFSRHQQALREYGGLGDAGADMAGLVGNLDGDEHRRIKFLLMKAFAPAALRNWETDVERVIAAALAEVADRPAFDLLADFSMPIAERTVCAIMGVPPESYAPCAGWGAIFIAHNRMAASTAEFEEKARAAVGMANSHFNRFIDEKIARPDDSFISLLIRLQEDEDRLTRGDLIKVLRFVILGGTDNLANQLANGMWHLLRHPDQWELLKARPELVNNAVEEFLRYETSGRSNPRMAMEDIEIGGVFVPKGSTVFTFGSACNRDPARFPDPDRFDITRPIGEHMAFATGVHVCVGNHLARMVLRRNLAAIVATMPDLALATDTVAWRAAWIRSMDGLPVRRTGL